MELYEALSSIQKNLKVPKEKHNGVPFKSRSAEQILREAQVYVPDGIVINITDEVVLIGDRYYIKSTASLSNGKMSISSSAYAREGAEKRPLDPAQVTGLTCSYARKYALGGLFAIDDGADADTEPVQNSYPSDKSKAVADIFNDGRAARAEKKNVYAISEAQIKRMFAISKSNGVDQAALKKMIEAEGFTSSKDLTKEAYDKICNKMAGKVPNEITNKN